MKFDSTGHDVAVIAARVLPLSDKEIAHFAIDYPAELRALAGSALEQVDTRDRPMPMTPDQER